MPNTAPTSYEELVDLLERLPSICLDTRRRRGLSVRAAGAEIGVAASTVSRFENGDDAYLHDTVLPILRWVAT